LEDEPELSMDKIRCAYKKQKGRSKGSCSMTITGQNKERISIPITKEDDVEAIKGKIEKAYLELKRRSKKGEN